MYNNLDLKIIPPLDGCHTVRELANKGCPICKRKLYPEASTRFGSLFVKITTLFGNGFLQIVEGTSTNGGLLQLGKTILQEKHPRLGNEN